MKYKEMYSQAQKNNQTEAISSIFKKEWKKNEEIIGRLINIQPVQDPKFNKEYYSYLFNTDDGNIKTALGAGVDGEVRPFMVTGEVYRVQFQGTVDTGKGSPMKVFKVEHIITDQEPEHSDVGQSDDEIPI
jgi:hypothetical protein